MSRMRLHSDVGWPTSDDILLLRAATADKSEAHASWTRWTQARDLDAIDSGSFALLPAVYRNLQGTGPEPDRLRGIYRYAWARFQLFKAGAARVAAALGAARVPVVFLKGLPLQALYYRDPATRMMEDMDILIRPEQLRRAAAALRREGWAPRSFVPRADLMPFVGAVEFVHSRYSPVDVHVRGLPVDVDVDDEALRDRLVPADLHECRVLTPDSTDLALMTLIHSRKLDTQGRIRWLLDLHALATAGAGPDWRRLVERAREAAILLPVRDALLFARDRASLPVPAWCVEQAFDAILAPGEQDRYARLLRSNQPALGSVWGRLCTYWRRYRDRARAVGRSRTLAGFLRASWGMYRVGCGLPRWWQVPIHLVRRLGTGSAVAPRASLPARKGGTPAKGYLVDHGG
jgi:hypothetical protein